MRLHRYLVPHDQVPICRGDRAQDRRVEEDHIKTLLAQSGVSGGLVDEMEFNLDHHRRDGSIELSGRVGCQSDTLKSALDNMMPG
jgi:hypothetical protein